MQRPGIGSPLRPPQSQQSWNCKREKCISLQSDVEFKVASPWANLRLGWLWSNFEGFLCALWWQFCLDLFVSRPEQSNNILIGGQKRVWFMCGALTSTGPPCFAGSPPLLSPHHWQGWEFDSVSISSFAKQEFTGCLPSDYLQSSCLQLTPRWSCSYWD